MEFRQIAAAALAVLVVAGGAVAQAGPTSKVSDPRGDHPDGIAAYDIVKATAKASNKQLKFVIRLAGSNSQTKDLTSIRLRGSGGNYYLNVTDYGDGGTSREWRPYDFARAKIKQRGDSVHFKIRRSKVGNPKRKIRWSAVSGAGGNYDYAPNRGLTKLKL